ncbi:hypothetical protein DJ82_06950 [Halorubrum sp. Ib24]|uniref:hypothetical protein n=1 Tax=Halorubrum sp. Ib24 TaxID=1383850 RepID=UPI000B97E9E6|nr:hypothetical protein [Halorubrum sp. Ib24]OYR40823.1 hypothetical protein DJ82_06950 [Halorubrum sp. Ib24]
MSDELLSADTDIVRHDVQHCVSTRVTDATSAAVIALVVWGVGRSSGRTPRELVRPTPFLGGAIVAFVIECVFARWPARAARLWRRPSVRVGSPVALLVGTLLAARRNSDTAFAVTLGGLTGYFALLLGIGAGVVPEPATWFERETRDTPS